MNEKVKEGCISASLIARKTYSVESFFSEMKIGIQNTHGIRDHMLPVETTLELGVGNRYERYLSRTHLYQPFKMYDVH